jgi:hypothetical protein
MILNAYEAFVKAVLVKRFGIPANELLSTREKGAILPGNPELLHQIDLFHIARTEIADYITIIECKHRSTRNIDQSEIAKFAFVKGSVKASKAIMVSDLPFTEGAVSLAKSERIALLTLSPDETILDCIKKSKIEDLFQNIIQAIEQRPASYKMDVVCRLMPDPKERGLDLNNLLDDPTTKKAIHEISRKPQAQQAISEILRTNPSILGRSSDFLNRF